MQNSEVFYKNLESQGSGEGESMATGTNNWVFGSMRHNRGFGISTGIQSSHHPALNVFGQHLLP